MRKYDMGRLGPPLFSTFVSVEFISANFQLELRTLMQELGS